MSDDNEIQKLPTYQRLQNLFSEDDDPTLTKKANDNINKLLGIEDEVKPPSFLDKFKKFLKKMDGYIFRKNEKISSRYQKR